MCLASSPTPPAPIVIPDEPKKVDENARLAGDQERKKAALARGRGSTVLTGARGLTAPAVVTGKSVLGG